MKCLNCNKTILLDKKHCKRKRKFCSRDCYFDYIKNNPVSKKTKEKLRKSHLGKKGYWTGKKRPDISKKQKGKVFSKETRKKMSEAKLKNPTKYWLGKKRPMMSRIGKLNKGRHLSKEHKQKLSKVLKGKVVSKETREKISKAQKGCLSSNWKGGISKDYKIIRNSSKFKIWRKKVFERDNYTCQKCGKKGSYLHPHHIENFSMNKKKRFLIKNGITFCKKCHLLFHKKYGYNNNSKEQIKLFKDGKSKIQ